MSKFISLNNLSEFLTKLKGLFYVKPSNGIPKEDLDEEVRESLAVATVEEVDALFEDGGGGSSSSGSVTFYDKYLYVECNTDTYNIDDIYYDSRTYPTLDEEWDTIEQDYQSGKVIMCDAQTAYPTSPLASGILSFDHNGMCVPATYGGGLIVLKRNGKWERL